MRSSRLESVMSWCLAILLGVGFSLASAGHAECIRVRQANLREEPSMRSRVSWVVGRYMPLVVLGRKGGWSQVRDQDGEVHWVESSKLSRMIQCVAVKTSFSALKSGPGSGHPNVPRGLVEKYTGLKRVDLADDEPVRDWYRVVDETGAVGWVRQSQVWRPVTIMQVGF